MNKGDLLRSVGIFCYVILTFIDRFCFNVVDYIYIPIALIAIIFLIVGFIINRRMKWI